MKIGFIGMGNMGQALLRGMVNEISLCDIFYSCKNADKSCPETESGSVRRLDNVDLVKSCDLIILAVKPQTYAEIFDEIKEFMTSDKIVISLAPGKTIDYISRQLGTKRVVRAMPNTPAKIGCGMTGISYNENEFSNEEISVINKIFSSIGEFEKVDENLISAVVCASGSSPAYVYEFINQLANACASKGMTKETAIKFVSNAVIGAAKMVLASEETPEELKAKVCSKGGTTIAGLEKLYEAGFANAIINATDACFKRSEELSVN